MTLRDSHPGRPLVGLLITLATACQSAASDGSAATVDDSVPRLRETYESRLAELAERRNDYSRQPSSEKAFEIGRTLSGLQNTGRPGQARVAAVRERYSGINARGCVSERFVNLFLERDVNDQRMIQEYVLGNYTSGPAHTRGRITAQLIPDSQQAVLAIRLVGTTASNNNVAYSGPVTVYTSADTRINAHKRVLIDAHGVHPQPAQTQCATQVQIRDIAASRRIIERIAWRRASRLQPQVEQAAAQRAELRTAENLDQQANGMLAQADKAFHEQVRAPLVRIGALPAFTCSTTRNRLQISGLLANDVQLGAPSQPEMNPGHDLAVCLHESLFSNLGETALGGKKLMDRDFLDVMQVLTGEAPTPLWVHARSERWFVILTKDRPLQVALVEDRVQITFRLQEITRGSDHINRPLEISAKFRMKITPDGPHVIRDGDLLVRFIDGGKATESEAEFLAFVRNKFSGVFPPELYFDGLVPPAGGEWGKLRQLQLKEISARSGWFVIGYQLPARDTRLTGNTQPQ